MKIITIFLIICLTTQEGSTQDRTFFNILPDIGAVRNQSKFAGVTVDSQHIYVIGQMVSIVDSLGNNKDFNIHISKFDYQGNFLGLNLVKDSLLNKPFIEKNTPIYKINDSTIYYLIGTIIDPNYIYAAANISKLNLNTGKLLNNLVVPNPISGDASIVYYTQTEIKDGNLSIVYNFQDGNSTNSNYILTIDSAMNIKQRFKLPEDAPQTNDYYRWIERNKNGDYELIGETTKIIQGNFTPKGNLFYLKVNSIGQVLKKVEIKLPGNFYIGLAQTFTIYRNRDKNFVLAFNNYYEGAYYSIRPHIMKTSSEFDTVFWLTNFSEYPDFVEDPYYWLYSMCKLKDNSGYIAACALDYSFVRRANFGFLIKVSETGDSLWLRKYQPMSWDTSRARWMDFNQIVCTPYNTIAVVATVSDRQEQHLTGWLLHLDSEGCLIPGCGKIVRVEDIRSGKEKAFEIYPNPTSSDHIYLQSRISSSQDFHIGIYNLQGKELKITKFRPQEGVQYILDLPQEVPNGEYILQIRGIEFNQSEKLVISK